MLFWCNTHIKYSCLFDCYIYSNMIIMEIIILNVICILGTFAHTHTHKSQCLNSAPSSTSYNAKQRAHYINSHSLVTFPKSFTFILIHMSELHNIFITHHHWHSTTIESAFIRSVLRAQLIPIAATARGPQQTLCKRYTIYTLCHTAETSRIYE